MTHSGKTWISMVDNNVWEPGAAGAIIVRSVRPDGKPHNNSGAHDANGAAAACVIL